MNLSFSGRSFNDLICEILLCMWLDYFSLPCSCYMLILGYGECWHDYRWHWEGFGRFGIFRVFKIRIVTLINIWCSEWKMTIWSGFIWVKNLSFLFRPLLCKLVQLHKRGPGVSLLKMTYFKKSIIVIESGTSKVV